MQYCYSDLQKLSRSSLDTPAELPKGAEDWKRPFSHAKGVVVYHWAMAPEAPVSDNLSFSESDWQVKTDWDQVTLRAGFWLNYPNTDVCWQSPPSYACAIRDGAGGYQWEGLSGGGTTILQIGSTCPCLIFMPPVMCKHYSPVCFQLKVCWACLHSYNNCCSLFYLQVRTPHCCFIFIRSFYLWFHICF